MKGSRLAALGLAVAMTVGTAAFARAEAPATLAATTGDLYPEADGSLAASPAGPPAPCVGLGGSAPASATFATRLADGAATLLAASVTVVLALAGSEGAAQSGTGFVVQGTLEFANATIQAPPFSVPPAQSPASATLTFEVPNGTAGAAALALTITLERAPGPAPVPVAQDVQVLCGSPDTRVASFAFARGLPGDADANADGVPDREEPPSRSELMLAARAVFGVALVAGLATLGAGALALAGRTISERRIHLLLGATAGLLLAISIIDLIPEALAIEEGAAWTVALGVLALFLVKWVGANGHAHGGREHGHAHEPHSHALPHSGRLALIAFFALSFHRFVDGLVLPAAFEVGSATGLAAAAAVLVHQFPDGIAAATVFLAAGWPRAKVFRGVGAMAVLTPVGTLLGLFIAGLDQFIGHLIALAAATFVFIALAELIPELSRPEHRWTVAAGFVIGYVLVFGIELVAGLAGGG